MTAAADTAPLPEPLGERVWDALETAGIKHFGHTGDGFQILTHRDDPDHVAVTVCREGPLFGCGGNAVDRQMLGRWIVALHEAGFAADLFQHGGHAYCAVTADTEDAMQHGMKLALASVTGQAEQTCDENEVKVA